MNKALISTIAFVTGAAIGSVITWKIIKTKYEQIAQEEIDSVKEVFARRDEERNGPRGEKPDDADVTEYASITSKYAEPGKEDDSMTKKPYIISPDEYDEIDGYDALSLTYYADGTVTDDMDDPMSDSDIERTIGRDSLNHFGEYEGDENCVYVRNEEMKADYEIQRDSMTYQETHYDA